jgi:hypothetical protein
VALSADASTLVIGASGYNSFTGYYVKVYRTDDDGGNRLQLGQTIYGNATGNLFGRSVDIAANGMHVVLGSPGNHNHMGYVQVFSLDSSDEAVTSTWKQIGENIAREAIGDEIGLSVTISDDGETIAVGAYPNDGNNAQDSGRVRIYRLENNGTSWEQFGEDIDGKAAGDWSGHSVSLSSNGSFFSIGSIGAGMDGVWADGQVKVLRIDSGGSRSWEQLGESICGDNSSLRCAYLLPRVDFELGQLQ